MMIDALSTSRRFVECHVHTKGGSCKESKRDKNKIVPQFGVDVFRRVAAFGNGHGFYMNQGRTNVDDERSGDGTIETQNNGQRIMWNSTRKNGTNEQNEEQWRACYNEFDATSNHIPNSPQCLGLTIPNDPNHTPDDPQWRESPI
jgi:hypothetical protein